MNKNKLGVIIAGIIWALFMMAIFSSCNQPDSVYYDCRDSKIVILKKDIHRSRAGISYSLYVFDGETAHSYWTNEQTYNSHNVGDTLNTLFLSKTETYTKK